MVAVARADTHRAEAYARANGIDPAYSASKRSAPIRDVDAVYSVRPIISTRIMPSAPSEPGKHASEKPLAITVEDAAAIVTEAERVGVVLAVPYYRRFYPVVEALARSAVWPTRDANLGPGDQPRLLPAASRRY